MPSPTTRSTTYTPVVSGPFYWTGYRKDNGAAISPPAITSSYTAVGSKTITSVDTPEFFKKKAMGEFLPINSVVISTKQWALTGSHSGSMTYKNPAVLGPSEASVYTGSHCVYFADIVDTDYTPSQSDIDAVVIKALSKAKEPDWDILTFMAEFPQTVRLLGTTFRRFNAIGRKVARKAFRREKRRASRQSRPYSAKRALDDFTSLWLEARYGWRPLLYDVQSILKVLAHKAKTDLTRRTATMVVDIDTTATNFIDYGSVRYDTELKKKGKCKLRAVVYHRSDMSPIGANPVITLWEVTRFSFIVDWFIDVGSWLQAISPRVGYNQLGVSVSTVSDYSQTKTQVAGEGSGHAWSISVSPLVTTQVVKTYKRDAYSGVPLPSFQVNLNKLKVIDLIALALQGRSDVARILKL